MLNVTEENVYVNYLTVFTLEERAYFPDAKSSLTHELAEGHFKEEDRDPSTHQAQEVGDEERS